MRENCFPSCETLPFALPNPYKVIFPTSPATQDRHCNSSLSPSKKTDSKQTPPMFIPPSCWMMGLLAFVSYNFPWQTTQSKTYKVFWVLLRQLSQACPKKTRTGLEREQKNQKGFGSLSLFIQHVTFATWQNTITIAIPLSLLLDTQHWNNPLQWKHHLEFMGQGGSTNPSQGCERGGHKDGIPT